MLSNLCGNDIEDREKGNARWLCWMIVQEIYFMSLNNQFVINGTSSALRVVWSIKRVFRGKFLATTFCSKTRLSLLRRKFCHLMTALPGFTRLTYHEKIETVMRSASTNKSYHISHCYVAAAIHEISFKRKLNAKSFESFAWKDKRVLQKKKSLLNSENSIKELSKMVIE